MASIIDWTHANGRSQATHRGIHIIASAVVGVQKAYEWRAYRGAIEAQNQVGVGITSSLNKARLEAEQFARDLADQPTPESTPESTPKATNTAPGALQLLDAKLVRARALYIAMGSMAAEHAWQFAAERHGVLSAQASAAQTLVKRTADDLGALFDLEMAEVEQSTKP